MMMMTTLLIKILLSSIFCCSIRIAFEDGMILAPVKNTGTFCLRFVFGYNHGNFLVKPLFTCHYCMASTYGSVAFWIITLFISQEQVTTHTYYHWLFTCVCLIFVNGVLYSYLNKRELEEFKNNG